MCTSWRLALAFATTLALSAPALAQSQEAATVMQVRQPARGASASSSTWRDLTLKTSLRAGDIVKTGEGGATELLFSTGAQLTVGEASVLRLLDQEGLRPRLMTGRARLVAPPRGVTYLQAGDYRLSGSDLEAVVERVKGQWRVSVLAGSLNLAAEGEEAFALDAGKVATLGGPEPIVATLNYSRATDAMRGLRFDAAKTPARLPARPAPVAATPAVDTTLAVALSAMLPGTGQLYAGDVTRGLIYLGLDFALLGTGFYLNSIGQTQMAGYSALGLLGLNIVSPFDALLAAPSPPPVP